MLGWYHSPEGGMAGGEPLFLTIAGAFPPDPLRIRSLSSCRGKGYSESKTIYPLRKPISEAHPVRLRRGKVRLKAFYLLGMDRLPQTGTVR